MNMSDIELLLAGVPNHSLFKQQGVPQSAENRAKTSARLKGVKKTKQHIERMAKANTKRIFQGKSAKQWSEILNGDKGMVVMHIRNNTMETYGPYRKYAGLPPIPRNQNLVNVKDRFQDKTIRQWREILKGDVGEIRKHIKNNTMETYGPYRKYAGLPPLPRGQWNLKHFMTPKGIMTYEQAKKAFGFNDNGTILRRARSDNFPDWYEVCVK